MSNEYLVTKDYHNEQFDFDLVKGDVVSEKSFDKASRIMVDRLVGRGILLPIETETVEQAGDEHQGIKGEPHPRVAQRGQD